MTGGVMMKRLFLALAVCIIAYQPFYHSIAEAQNNEAFKVKSKTFQNLEKKTVEQLRERPQLYKKTATPPRLPQEFANREETGVDEDVVCDDTSCSCNGYISCLILEAYCGGTYTGTGRAGTCS